MEWATDTKLYNQRRIAEALRKLQQAGGEQRYLIFSDGEYYVQFLPGMAADSLYAEAIGNQGLSESAKLTERQLDRLRELGWSGPDPLARGNFTCEWTNASNDERQTEVARLVRQTFVEAYGVAEPAQLQVELNLE